MNDVCERLTNQASEIASAGHNGWGNTMLEAAEEISRLRRDAERYRRLRHKMTCGSFTAAEELAVIGAKTADAFDAAVDAMSGANAKLIRPATAD